MPTSPEVIARLDEFVARRMRADGTPGAAVALTDRERLLGVATYGFADVAAGTPVAPETLFEIGSIGKTFTAVAALQLSEAGALDLQAPVTAYLPWFRVRSAHGPITLHHLLSHTAGIIAGMDQTPEARYQAWALRETEAGGPPGERFHYSNLGYKVLGLVVERVTGEPYGETIRRRILVPLGMAASEAVITHDTRRRLAVGYATLYDDRPWRPEHPLVPATWLQTDTADGSIAATPADLAVFLRMLLNRGRGPGGRLLSEEGFALLTRPAATAWGGAGYGYGLFVRDVDGGTEIGHPGGMVGYVASMRGDLERGLGAVAFMNGPGDPMAVTRYALALLRAVHDGAPLPPLPPEADTTVLPEAAAYAGTYRAGERAFTIAARGDGLVLVTPSEDPAPLEVQDEDAFFVVRADFARSLLRFGREGERVVEAFHDGTWYVNERYAGPTAFDVPEGWRAYPGPYRSHNPWIPYFRVELRKDWLWLVFPGGDPDGFAAEQPLMPLGDGRFRVGDDPHGPERLAFDTVVDGEALRANLSGGDYYRFPLP